MELRKTFLGSKNNEDQMNAFRLTTQIMKYEDFIRDTEKQLRTMDQSPKYSLDQYKNRIS